jgi:hypothetical protein
MHLEAYLPVQTGLIAFEVCKGLASSENAKKKFNDYFAKNVIKPLEKNALKACDMNESSRATLLWRKLQYKVPKEIKAIIEN